MENAFSRRAGQVPARRVPVAGRGDLDDPSSYSDGRRFN
jgi:hypothetical protein